MWCILLSVLSILGSLLSPLSDNRLAVEIGYSTDSSHQGILLIECSLGMGSEADACLISFDTVHGNGLPRPGELPIARYNRTENCQLAGGHPAGHRGLSLVHGAMDKPTGLVRHRCHEDISFCPTGSVDHD